MLGLLTSLRHLLGKKSWNVYNAANIERVKADEAKAAAREEAEEQRLQEIDAEKRIQILRGTYEESQHALEKAENEAHQGSDSRSGRERKRRRIAGENDTDREIRYAQEDRTIMPARAEMQMVGRKTCDAPLTDGQGHINLFPPESRTSHEIKNTEVEREKARQKKEYEDQYTMRFSNAGGFKQAVEQKPWYENGALRQKLTVAMEKPSKDAWGNEDPRRKEREKMRIAADDPLVAMRNGAAGVRHAEKEKVRWREEKRQEIKELDEDKRRRERRRRRRQEDDLRASSRRLSHNSSYPQRHRDENAKKTWHHTHRHRKQKSESERYGSHRHGRRIHD